jgi:cytochrome c5
MGGLFGQTRGALLRATGFALVVVGVGCASDLPTRDPMDGVIPGTPGGLQPMGYAGSTSINPLPGTPGSGMPVTPGGITVPTPGNPVVTGEVPCAVDTVVKSRCQTCHGASPIGGAPMPLVTLADWQRDHMVRLSEGYIGQTMKVHAISRIRIQPTQGTKRMPQGLPLSDPDFAALDGWLAGGALAGQGCDAGPGPMAGSGPVVGNAGAGGSTVMGGTGGGGPLGTTNQCDITTNYQPLVARDGETCYEFLTHNNSGESDTAKFQIIPGESYNQLYYSIPWPADTVATRFGADFDNEQYLHHWLGFKTTVRNPGAVSKNVLGTTLGESTELVGGWAVGGCNTEFEPDIGLKLPDPSYGGIMIQWHHYNTTNTIQEDGSKVQWCTVPASMRPNIGGLTFLGTEYLGMPPGITDIHGSCTNDSGADITIFGFEPHMHTIGIHMKSIVHPAGGGPSVTVFDQPFQFDAQYNYTVRPRIVLKPNDVIESICTFNNPGPGTVDFGQSTNQEMCYQFALAYPHGALNNGVISLIGSENTCW